ncbi:GGDEF domain-containing protein [Arcobacter sp. 31_11_sub10_T18]|nr:GGDEF domain-containing protein [Arcobacter sp. 31_11_sub10_T18]
MNTKWEKILTNLDFAFQPIVNTITGKTYGVEALLRNVSEAGGFYSIINCFDEAFNQGILYEFDLRLRQKAIEKYSSLDTNSIQLFFNIDNRLLYMPDYSCGNTQQILEKYKLDKTCLCFELSERGTLQDHNAIISMVNKYKQDGYDIAIDDFGTGVSGLQLLYHSQAKFIKLDRFFIQDIESDSKKRLFCASIINIAHLMGIQTIAEGVESEIEYYTCKDIGVDFIQGFVVQKPKIDISRIKNIYTHIAKLYKTDKRKEVDNLIDEDYISYVNPILHNATLHDLFLYFKENPSNSFVPVVNESNHLTGIIYEDDIKKISYSQYGIALSKNLSNRDKFSSYVKPILSVEVSWGIDKSLEVYNSSKNSPKGIFLTRENCYYGFINVNNLLSLSYKRNIEIARDQNPLTKLPGNQQINDYINSSFKNKSEHQTHIVYLDFNDFKPFNDYYGFRQGDRAIIMFSELLKKNISSKHFIAHVGGDDFFLGFKDSSFNEIYLLVKNLCQTFHQNAKNFYSPEDRENGYISSTDRFGTPRQFKLLSVSSAIIEISNLSNKSNLDHVLGQIKKASKKTEDPLGVSIK